MHRKKLPRARPLFSRIQLITYDEALKIVAKERGLSFDEAKHKFPDYIHNFDHYEDFYKDIVNDYNNIFPDDQGYIIVESTYDTEIEDILYEIAYIDKNGDIETVDISDYITEKMIKQKQQYVKKIKKSPEHKRTKLNKFKKIKGKL